MRVSDTGSYEDPGSAAVLASRRVRLKSDAVTARVQGGRPCGQRTTHITLRFSKRRLGELALAQFLITASPRQGVLGEGKPVMVQLLNQYDADISLGDLVAEGQEQVSVYMHVPQRGWLFMETLTLRVPC